MTKYPRLAEMGVLHPEQIAHYSVSSIDYTDHLRIVYDRPKGSLLPVSRSYRFPRVQKTRSATGDGPENSVVMESSAEFREANAELQALLATREVKQTITAQILDELRQFEDEFTMRSENLRGLIEKIPKT